MDGHAEKAEPLLRQAAQNSAADPKVSQNLALVLGLQGKSEDAKSVILKTGSADAANDDAALVKEMIGASDAPKPASFISTGSTNTSKPKAKAASKAQAKPVADAPVEDPALLVQRLADSYASTPVDAPVQLTPRR